MMTFTLPPPSFQAIYLMVMFLSATVVNVKQVNTALFLENSSSFGWFSQENFCSVVNGGAVKETIVIIVYSYSIFLCYILFQHSWSPDEEFMFFMMLTFGILRIRIDFSQQPQHFVLSVD